MLQEFHFQSFSNNVSLLFMLLNPFLMSIYLASFIRRLDIRHFSQTISRACLISGFIFVAFALSGDYIFSRIMHSRFASFQIFGGIVFLLISLKFIFKGTDAIEDLRGNAEHLNGSVALPFMIGPGTVSASVLIGGNLDTVMAPAAIMLAVSLTFISLVFVKKLHDFVHRRNEALIERYLEIVGRLNALYIGTYSIEMILRGLESVLSSLPAA